MKGTDRGNRASVLEDALGLDARERPKVIHVTHAVETDSIFLLTDLIQLLRTSDTPSRITLISHVLTIVDMKRLKLYGQVDFVDINDWDCDIRRVVESGEWAGDITWILHGVSSLCALNRNQGSMVVSFLKNLPLNHHVILSTAYAREHGTLLTALASLSDINVAVTGFGSGSSSELSGQIRITRGPACRNTKFQPMAVYYKLQERKTTYLKYS